MAATATKNVFHRQSLLSRQAILVGAIVVAISLSFAAHFVFSSTTQGYCTPTPLPQWIKNISGLCAAIFTANIILQCMFVFHIWLLNPKGRAAFALDMRMIILVIHLIAVSSPYATYFGWFGNILCIDGFGVHSLLVQWPEWFAAVPLLAFSAMSMTSEDSCSYSEILFIAVTALMILCGFLIIVDHDHKTLYFTCSSMCMISILYFRQLFLDKFRLTHHSQLKRSSQQEVEYYQQQLQANWRHKMLLRFFIICCFYPTVYVAVSVKIITPNMGIAGFIVGSLLGKLFFSTYLAQCYAELYADIELHHTVEQIEEETRLKLLRLVFHELCSPLNSLSIGVQMLGDSLLNQAMYTLREDDTQILETIQRSTKMLTDHVDQVLSFHRAQRGELSAKSAPFHLHQWATGVHTYALSALHTVGAKIKMTVCQRLPQVIEGDAERMELMMQSLFSYLALYLKPHGEVDMIISEMAPLDYVSRTTVQHNTPPLGCSSAATDGLYASFIIRFVIDTMLKIVDFLLLGNLLTSGGFLKGSVKKKDNLDVDQKMMIDLYILVQSDDFTLSAEAMIDQLLKPHHAATVVHKLCTNHTTTDENRPQEKKLSRTVSSDFDLSLAAEIFALVAMGEILILNAQVTTEGQQPLSQGICFHLRVASAANGEMFSPTLNVPEEGTDKVDEAKAECKNGDDKLPSLIHTSSPLHSVPPAIDTQIIATSPRGPISPRVDDASGNTNIKQSESSSDLQQVSSSAVVSVVLAPPLIKLRALIVDDVASNSKMLGYLLRKKGQETTIVDNGQAAVDLVQFNQSQSQSEFDIIFMDFTMPIMNGPTAVSKLRSLGYDKHIIGVTGNVLKEDIDCFINAGVDAVFMKPLQAHHINLLFSHLLHHGILSHHEQYRLNIEGDHLQMMR